MNRVIVYTSIDGTMMVFSSLKPLFTALPYLEKYRSKIMVKINREHTVYDNGECQVQRQVIIKK